MEKVTIVIELGNDEMKTASDVAGALCELAVKIKELGLKFYSIRDSNGNKVGECNVE